MCARSTPSRAPPSRAAYQPRAPLADGDVGVDAQLDVGAGDADVPVRARHHARLPACRDTLVTVQREPDHDLVTLDGNLHSRHLSPSRQPSSRRARGMRM